MKEKKRGERNGGRKEEGRKEKIVKEWVWVHEGGGETKIKKEERKKGEEEVAERGGELKQKVRYVDVQRRFRHRPNLQTATGFGSSTPAV